MESSVSATIPVTFPISFLSLPPTITFTLFSNAKFTAPCHPPYPELFSGTVYFHVNQAQCISEWTVFKWNVSLCELFSRTVYLYVNCFQVHFISMWTLFRHSVNVDYFTAFRHSVLISELFWGTEYLYVIFLKVQCIAMWTVFRHSISLCELFKGAV